MAVEIKVGRYTLRTNDDLGEWEVTWKGSSLVGSGSSYFDSFGGARDWLVESVLRDSDATDLNQLKGVMNDLKAEFGILWDLP